MQGHQCQHERHRLEQDREALLLQGHLVDLLQGQRVDLLQDHREDLLQDHRVDLLQDQTPLLRLETWKLKEDFNSILYLTYLSLLPLVILQRCILVVVEALQIQQNMRMTLLLALLFLSLRLLHLLIGLLDQLHPLLLVE